MTKTRYNKNFGDLGETKNLIKHEMKIKEYKEDKSSRLGNENFEDLRYEPSLSKERRFKTFYG